MGGAPWWRHAVVYEVYPRSFADGNGDGEGDLVGLRERLPYLAALGVDGLWIAPWYPSPLADGGYDVTDFRDIHPLLGTLGDAESLISEAHALGLKIIIDVVPNHTSNEHPWFVAALAAGPGSRERERYFFRDGRGVDGNEPPNNWISAFGGSAWTRTTEPGGTPGQWYLHLFAEEQPDLNWADPDVLADYDAVLRFWLDRGVDGIRVDAAPAIGKKPDLPDADYGDEPRFVTIDWVDNPHWDIDEVHAVFRRWRAVADTYATPDADDVRVFVAEAVVGPSRLATYLAPDEMHTAFNFPFMKTAWDADSLRAVVDATLAQFSPIGVPSTWVTASHDEVRLVTRYGRKTTSSAHVSDGQGEVVDLALGTRRARASALLTLGLPGGAYVYQGEELGLPNVDDLPDEVLQDPMFFRTNGEVRGRDGCRVPLPWAGTTPPYGFSPDGVATWLPQPEGWADLSVAAQTGDPSSTLELYRAALRLRHELPGLQTEDFAWAEGVPTGVLDFLRGPDVRCLLNLSGSPVPVGDGWAVALASGPTADGLVPHDTAAWLVRTTGPDVP